MKKDIQNFSKAMMKLVKEKELDYLFAGEGNQVISTNKVLQLILQMNNSEMIWENLKGNSHEQEEAILKVRDHLLEVGFLIDYESNGKFFYLIINK